VSRRPPWVTNESLSHLACRMPWMRAFRAFIRSDEP
jgi:hypothetical protein